MMPSNSKQTFRALSTQSTWEQVVEASSDRPVVIFKHSSACPVSHRAQREMEQLSEGEDAPPVYRLVVQESRSLSNHIEQALGVRHETPQVIVLKDGAPVWDASHGRVQAREIQDVLASDASMS